MKKLLIAGCLMFSLTPSAVFADARSDLQGRLSKVNSFHASFSQSVRDANRTEIQDGEGELWVKRPNLFRWHMTSPDDSLLISDGKTLWFYNPFVEQVTATWLNSVTGDTPFMLITRNDPADWSKYNITQKGDEFELTPKAGKGSLKTFSISVTPDGAIKGFVVVEQDNQRSTYVLKGQQSGSVDASQFTFTPPADVTLDDQRQ